MWLRPALIREARTLYVDFDTSFGPGYGDTLSWSSGYQPGLGEREQQVVTAVDVGGVEKLMLDLLRRPQPPALGLPLLP